ncbi:hypothetical protein ABBQ38_010448 [Trebouxia sp. C0009 RCD-2024]
MLHAWPSAMLNYSTPYACRTNGIYVMYRFLTRSHVGSACDKFAHMLHRFAPVNQAGFMDHPASIRLDVAVCCKLGSRNELPLACLVLRPGSTWLVWVQLCSIRPVSVSEGVTIQWFVPPLS